MYFTYPFRFTSFIGLCLLAFGSHAHPEMGHVQRRQERTHRADIALLCLALDCLRRADRARAGSRRRADRRRRALHLRAAGTRARGALAGFLAASRVINNYRLLLRNTTLKHILAQIRHRGAFSFQHIQGHIRAGRAGRDSAL